MNTMTFLLVGILLTPLDPSVPPKPQSGFKDVNAIRVLGVFKDPAKCNAVADENWEKSGKHLGNYRFACLPVGKGMTI